MERAAQSKFAAALVKTDLQTYRRFQDIGLILGKHQEHEIVR